MSSPRPRTIRTHSSLRNSPIRSGYPAPSTSCARRSPASSACRGRSSPRRGAHPAQAAPEPPLPQMKRCSRTSTEPSAARLRPITRAGGSRPHSHRRTPARARPKGRCDMRPHHLVIEGFGPFRDRQTIDFDSVSHDGIFLIAGPTGAGKTSILDALCFALFNTVPGPRGSASDLRSHLAAPTDPTRVELVFSSAGRRFRIERVPQHLRPRKRGTGMTTQQHAVALAECIDWEWAGISRTAQETQSFLDGVIGLNAAQFTKLVVLPQGDFAAFLHADPSEREAILEKLFAT